MSYNKDKDFGGEAPVRILTINPSVCSNGIAC